MSSPRYSAAALAMLALASTATRARAQNAWTLHLLGPPAASAERRVVAVLEGPQGCVAARDVHFAVLEPGASVETLGESGEGCAQWLVVRTESGQPLATLEATSGEGRAQAQIDFAAHSRLELRARRDEGLVSVTIRGGEALAVTAYTAHASTPLDHAGDAWRAAVPDQGPVLLVAQGDGVFGATVLLGSPEQAPRAHTEGRATVLLAPTRDAIVAGGAARVAAVVATFDARGRPTRAVSLSVTSERGLLRSLEWVATGLAKIRLGAPVGVASVDLSVAAPGAELRRLDIGARGAGVPMRAELRIEPLPPTAGTETRLVAQAWDEAGGAIVAERLSVRCADGVTRAVDSHGVATCPASPAAATAFLVVSSTDGAVLVPLAFAELPPTPVAIAQPSVVPTVPPRAPASRVSPPPRRRLWTLGARVIGGIDMWGRLAAGAGARLGLAFGDRVRVEAGMSYTVVGVGAPPSGLAATQLDGVAHTVEAPVGIDAVIVRGTYGLGARATVAPAWVRDAGQVGALSSDGSAWRLAATLVAGPRITTRDVELGLDLGVRVAAPLTDGAWAEPALRLVVEASGALAL